MASHSTKTFGAKHGISDARVRQLLRNGRIYPAEKIGDMLWIIYPNAVIIPRWERPNRKLRRAN
jgi:hypothetical protein